MTEPFTAGTGRRDPAAGLRETIERLKATEQHLADLLAPATVTSDDATGRDVPGRDAVVADVAVLDGAQAAPTRSDRRRWRRRPEDRGADVG